MHSGNESKGRPDTFRRALSHPHAGLTGRTADPPVNLDFTGTEDRTDRAESLLNPGVEGPGPSDPDPFAGQV